MLQFHASAFIKLMQQMSTLHAIISENPVFEKIDHDVANATFDPLLRALAEHLDSLRLPVSASSLKRLRSLVEESAANGKAIGRSVATCAIDDLSQRIFDELNLRRLFSIQSHEEYLSDDAEPFGDAVSSRFRTASYDMAEAGKCLALRRSTACAFHLLRVIDLGVLAICRALEIDIPKKGSDKSWGGLLKLIQDKIIEKGNMGHLDPWMQDDDRAAFQQMHDAVAYIKNWRDPTMHAETKYTEEEAEQLFAMAKGFMQKVASRLDENGRLTSDQAS